MKFEDLRKQYPSDAALAQALFDECAKLRTEVKMTESMLQLREAQRRRELRYDEPFTPR